MRAGPYTPAPERDRVASRTVSALVSFEASTELPGLFGGGGGSVPAVALALLEGDGLVTFA